MAKGAGTYRVDARGARANLQRMHKGYQDVVEQAMIKAMGEGQRTAISFARRRTGALQLSIKRDVNVGKGRVSGKLWAYVLNSKGKDYARYQELGFNHWKSGKWIEGTHFIDMGRKVAERVFRKERERRMEVLMRK